MTLVILNTVARAQQVHAALLKQGALPDRLVLIHSRFRLADRMQQMSRLPQPRNRCDLIVVTTQAIEAGVDLSAATDLELSGLCTTRVACAERLGTRELFRMHRTPCDRSLSSEGGERRRGRRAPWPRLLPLAVAFMVAAAVADVAAQTPTITLSVSPSSVGEDDGSADVTVTATLSAPRTGPTVVTLSAAGTAIDPDDYQVLGSLPSVTIATGQTQNTATLVFSLVDDTLYEGDETIALGGSSGGAAVVPSFITVRDDDTQPTITLAQTATSSFLWEASPADTISSTVTATLLGVSTFARDTTFTLDVGRGSATKGVDFTLTPDPYTVTIPAGTTVGTGSATFSVLDDSIYEGSIYVAINEEIRGVGTGTDHLGKELAFTYRFSVYTYLFFATIFDDETPPPVMKVSWPEQTDLHEDDPPQDITFDVNLSAPATSDLTVYLSVASSNNPGRFSASLSTPTILIPAGQTTGTATLTVTPMDDGVAQSHRTGVCVRARASGYPTTKSCLVRIQDSLTQIVVVWVGLHPQGHIILEGGRVVAEVDLNVSGFEMVGTPTLPVRIGGSLRALPCQHRGFAYNQLFCHYVVVAGDYAPDGVEVLDRLGVDGVTFRNPDTSASIPFDPTIPARLRGIRQLWIHGGQMWSFDLSTSLESVQEGVGARPVTVTATIAQGPIPETDVVLPLAVVDVTTSRRDYAVTGPQQITIPAGAAAGSTTLNLTALEDGIKENRRETLRFARGDTPYFATPVDFAIIDSPSVQLSVSPVSVAEDGGAQTVTVTATLGDPTDQVRPRAIPVTLRLAGTAVEGDDLALSGERVVTIAANARSGTAALTLTPVDDRLLEMDETIELHGSTPGLTVSGTELTLVDDEVQPQVILSVDDDVLLESDTGGTTVQVTARLDPSVMVRRGGGDDAAPGRLGDGGRQRGLHGVVVAVGPSDHDSGGDGYGVGAGDADAGGGAGRPGGRERDHRGGGHRGRAEPGDGRPGGAGGDHHAEGRRRAGRGGVADAAGDRRGGQRRLHGASDDGAVGGRDGGGGRAVRRAVAGGSGHVDVHAGELGRGADGDGDGPSRCGRDDARGRGADAFGRRGGLQRGDGGAGGGDVDRDDGAADDDRRRERERKRGESDLRGHDRRGEQRRGAGGVGDERRDGDGRGGLHGVERDRRVRAAHDVANGHRPAARRRAGRSDRDADGDAERSGARGAGGCRGDRDDHRRRRRAGADAARAGRCGSGGPGREPGVPGDAVGGERPRGDGGLRDGGRDGIGDGGLHGAGGRCGADVRARDDVADDHDTGHRRQSGRGGPGDLHGPAERAAGRDAGDRGGDGRDRRRRRRAGARRAGRDGGGKRGESRVHG